MTVANPELIIPAAESANLTLASIVLGNLTAADQAAFVLRLAGLVPPSWFGTGATEIENVSGEAASPVYTMLLSGSAYNLSWDYVLYTYVLQQSRIATASGVWLDRIAYDFFGTNLPRRSGELDTLYRGRIFSELFRQRATRQGIIQALIDLTGNTPKVMELWNPGDCGAYDSGGIGYDSAGAYGDLTFNNQIFVTAYRPSPSGVANVGGYDNPFSGYDVGGGEYIDDNWITGPITDSEIYEAVSEVIAAGMTAWTAIFDNVESQISSQLYFGDIDNTPLLSVLGGFSF